MPSPNNHGGRKTAGAAPACSLPRPLAQRGMFGSAYRARPNASNRSRKKSGEAKRLKGTKSMQHTDSRTCLQVRRVARCFGPRNTERHPSGLTGPHPSQTVQHLHRPNCVQTRIEAPTYHAKEQAKHPVWTAAACCRFLLPSHRVPLAACPPVQPSQLVTSNS